MVVLFGYQSVSGSVRASSLFVPFRAYNTVRVNNTVRVYNTNHEDLEEAAPFSSTHSDVTNSE